jgi:hypothetical protein
VRKLRFEEVTSGDLIKSERIQQMMVSTAIPILWKEMIEKMETEDENGG